MNDQPIHEYVEYVVYSPSRGQYVGASGYIVGIAEKAKTYKRKCDATRRLNMMPGHDGKDFFVYKREISAKEYDTSMTNIIMNLEKEIKFLREEINRLKEMMNKGPIPNVYGPPPKSISELNELVKQNRVLFRTP